MPDAELEGSLKDLYVVAFASSAGGLKALISILGTLPDDFAAAIVIVQHLSPNFTSYMAEILDRRTILDVIVAQEDDYLKAGVIYVAPPNWHLIIKQRGILGLNQTERVHFLRPSADLMFMSLAEHFTDHAIAVVLTGTGMDGTDGIKTIKTMGGMVVAQDEATSEFFGMPSHAIDTGLVDHVLPLDEIAPFLDHLLKTKTGKTY